MVCIENVVNNVEEWCLENFGDEENQKCKRYERHMPRILKGIRAAKEGEEETKEQREKRLANAIQDNSLLKAYKEGKEIPEEAKELIERYKKIEEMYMSDEQRNRSKAREKVNAQAVGQATYDTPTEVCLEAENVINELMQEQTKEGEINES
jgi:hypothetical protein